MEQTTPYSKTDKTITWLNKQFAKLFRARVLPMDELSVIEVSHEIYDQAFTLVEQEATRLAKSVYGSYRRKQSEQQQEEESDAAAEEESFDAEAFVLALVLAYNPVTKYVFKNEIDRKRARFAEGVLASNTPAEEVALAKRLLVAMNAQFQDDVTFETLIQAYSDNGTEHVKWVTHPDDRRCKQCAAMHGKIYPIDKVPAKPHMHCRCWVEEVKE